MPPRSTSITARLVVSLILPFLLALGCSSSSSPDDSNNNPPPAPVCTGFPPEPGESWTYQIVGTSSQFEVHTETVADLVNGRIVQRLRREADPAGLGEYVSCDPTYGEIEVASDWWDTMDPGNNGRYFWNPPLFHCEFGAVVGDSCVWTGKFGGANQREVSRVMAYEEVTVPAGTFTNTMRLRVTTYNADGSIYDGPLDNWIDDKVGLVRSEEVETGDAIELVSHFSPVVPGDLVQWNRRFGDADEQFALSVAADALGNIVVVGQFRGTVDFGGGPLHSAGGWDGFVAKFNASGAHQWSKRFGDGADQQAGVVAIDASRNIVVGGSFGGTINLGGGAIASTKTTDYFLARYTSSGSHTWSKRVDAPGALAADAAGNVIVAGRFDGSIDFGGGRVYVVGMNDMFVTKLNASGQHAWTITTGDGGDQAFNGVAVDASGNIAVIGWNNGVIDLGGGPLTAAGPYPYYGYDVVLAKLTPAGDHTWSKQFGDDETQYGTGVALDAAGAVSIVCDIAGGTIDLGGGALGGTVVVAGLDASGNHVWSKASGSGFVTNNVIASDGAGGVIVAGGFSYGIDFGGTVLQSSDYSWDVYLGRFDAAGGEVWLRGFGDEDFQSPTCVAVDPSGHVILTGYFAGKLNFGAGAMTSAGLDDAFLAKFYATPQGTSMAAPAPGPTVLKTRWLRAGARAGRR